ncbi:hypothetical protein Thpro_022098 [Acidihalobacter prosperus]|uniref:Uncharacterized protein n=1 Tax=Acidihalobacter prosperus TaxID=160660 RepID=A0A1A6C347_9GAMM|nr:hypothetical protein Thpro_022098 [Acidihalobacter prosperus]
MTGRCTDHEWASLPLGVVALFYRGEERVEIDMHDPSLHSLIRW